MLVSSFRFGSSPVSCLHSTERVNPLNPFLTQRLTFSLSSSLVRQWRFGDREQNRFSIVVVMKLVSVTSPFLVVEESLLHLLIRVWFVPELFDDLC